MSNVDVRTSGQTITINYPHDMTQLVATEITEGDNIVIGIGSATQEWREFTRFGLRREEAIALRVWLQAQGF